MAFDSIVGSRDDGERERERERERKRKREKRKKERKREKPARWKMASTPLAAEMTASLEVIDPATDSLFGGGGGGDGEAGTRFKREARKRNGDKEERKKEELATRRALCLKDNTGI